MKIAKTHKISIFLLLLVIGTWPFLASAQYYVSPSQKAKEQASPAPEPQENKSFFSRYFGAKKSEPKASKIQTAKAPKTQSNKQSGKQAQVTMPVPAPFKDPYSQQWLQDNQALSQKMASGITSINENTAIYAPCTTNETKAYKAIESNFDQIVKDRNLGKDRAARADRDIKRFLSNPDTANSTIFLYSKCGGSST